VGWGGVEGGVWQEDSKERFLSVGSVIALSCMADCVVWGHRVEWMDGVRLQ